MFSHFLVFIRVINSRSKYCFRLSFANGLYFLRSKNENEWYFLGENLSKPVME